MTKVIPGLSIIIPTRNRLRELDATLHMLSQLSSLAHSEVVVVDNGSSDPMRQNARLACGASVRTIRSERNLGAAGRNLGVESGANEWVLMLDDDSALVGECWQEVVQNARADVAAIGLDIRLPGGRHEAGGLPEVFVGCGVLIRRGAFLESGGYDEAFGYYAEEYDLCAKFLLNGWRIAHDGRAQVLHRKVSSGRDMNEILRRLVRNNVWVRQRYAPREIREREITAELDRYHEIAVREDALAGFERGVHELKASLADRPGREMPMELYRRFTGEFAAHEYLERAMHEHGVKNVKLIGSGRGKREICAVLRRLGIGIVEDERIADAALVATLAPGRMLDVKDEWIARSSLPIICGWSPDVSHAVGV